MTNRMGHRRTSIGARLLSAMTGLIVVFMIVPLRHLRAQEAGGTIVGTVTDPSGAAVASANVAIKNTATGVERSVSTNADGLYVAPNLVPGSYEIQVTATGFASTFVNEVVLTVGERREINVTLKIGQASDKVTVEGSTISDVQLVSSAVGNVVDSHSVVELPLNGRDWTSLTLLEPGVAQVRTQKALGIGNDRANRGQGVDITIGGNRPQGNNYRLDGVSINDQTSGAPGSIQGSVLGVDAVQEFSVVTSNAPADYGKTSGGVINAASRSGTNSFHGTVYEFLRNDKLDARNFFAPTKNPPLKRNQFGGSAGGPIIKDHTFFFADYEGVRQVIGNPSGRVVVPSQSAAQLAATNSAVLPYLALYPKPDAGTVANPSDPLGTGTFTFVSKTITNEDFFTSRIDHKISASDSLFGTYVFDKGNNANPDALDLNNIGTISRRHTVAIEESHVFSATLVNSARFGFNRTVSLAPTTLGTINSAAANTGLGFIPGRAVGLINVSGIANFTGGPHGVGEFDFHYNSFQVYEDLYWTRSKHSLKFGFYAERIQSNQLGGANPSGQFIFGSLSDFLNNNAPTSFNGPLANGITPRDLRQTIYSGYVQDDYKIRRNLTLNLGLRYEMSTVPTETANRLTTLVNLRTDTAPKLGSPYFSNPTLHNFAPRVGFAWDPFGTGKTSLRGAFGMYDVLPLPYEFELLSLFSTPFFEAATIRPPLLAAGDFPTNAWVKANNFVATNPSPNKVLRNGYLDPNPNRSYVMQWTLNVQRELFRDFTVTAGYIGSHGVHQPFHADDVNDFLPLSTPAGFLWPNGANAAQQVETNPNVGQISSLMWATSSLYDGLTLSAIKRLSHGLQFQGSYTFSRSIDDSSSGIAGDTFGNSVSSLFWFNPRLRRGLSDFNVSQLGVINAIWMVPTPQSWSAVPKWVASGWQLGGIYTVGSGLPFTPTIGGDPLGVKSPAGENFDFPNRVPGCNPVNGAFRSTAGGPHYLNASCFALPTAPSLAAGMCTPFTAVPGTCANLFGNSGRNTVIGPGLQDFDFSLFKNNPIHRVSESFNVQFRWEVFNIANHANFNPPLPGNRQVFLVSGLPNASAGLLNATSTPSRQMQFALKLIW
jgi:Carboxypeptidase regulatory-like domain